jgi:ribosomal protein L11 methyltransferase
MSHGSDSNGVPIGTSWSARVIVPMEYAEAFERVFANLAGVVSLYEWDENVKPVLWAVEGSFDAAPPRAELAARVALTAAAAGVVTPELHIAKVPAKDWLTESIASFPALRAGRFYIHGDHIKGPFPNGAVRLMINAATAFGSGQHASTLGCLHALDGMFRAGGPPRVGKLLGLDMGCGTGILGMAAATAARRPVLCADIDPEAVRVTRYNARRNGIASLIPAVMSDGTGDRAIVTRAPYGFITANILARPLVQMAHDLAGMLAPGGWLILAGFIRRDEAMVGNAYRAQGLRLVRRIRLAPWTTLVLRRPANYL